MRMRNQALIVVDVQNDFLPGGALGVADGHQAIVLLERLMGDVDVIVFTRDWHPEDHCSFVEPGLNPEYKDGSWPKHCVQGTEGAEIDTWLWNQALDTGKPILLVNKSFEQSEEVYSGFGGIVADVFNRDALTFDVNNLLWDDLKNAPVSLTTALRLFNVTDVKIGGLALDYCVKATALDAIHRSFETTVYLNATRPVAYLSGAAAITQLAYSGIILNAREF